MKLNKFQEDYVYNTIQAAASQFDGMLKFLSEITQLSEDSFNQFTGKLAKMIFDGTVEEDVLKLSPRLQKKYYESIKEEMKEVFEEEYKVQKKKIEYQLLTDAINYDLYKGYMLNADFNMNPLENMKDYLDIVNAKVNGKDWSDRLWASKKETMEDLNKMVKKLGKGYVTLSEVSKSVRKYQDKNTYAVKRLVRNELVRVQSGVNEKFDKDNGIEWQLFMATLDSRTSDICRSFDGRSFRINDPNKPIPPDGTHIQCRSCLIGIPDKNWRPGTRRDNETDEIIPYKAWKKENEVRTREEYAVSRADVSKPIKRKSSSEFKDREKYREHLAERRKQREEYSKYLEDKKAKILSRKPKYTTQKAEKRLLELGVKKVNLSDFDPLLLDDLVNTIELNRKLFPDADLGYIGSNINVVEDYIKKELYEDNIKYFMKAHRWTREQAIDYLKANMDFSSYDMDGGMIEASLGMVFNKRYAENIELFLNNELEQYLTGERVIGDGTIKTTFTHEYGHKVGKLLNDKGSKEGDIIRKVFKKYPNAFVSEYATENTGEMFAELYADFVLNPTPSDAVKYFGEILTKTLK